MNGDVLFVIFPWNVNVLSPFLIFWSIDLDIHITIEKLMNFSSGLLFTYTDAMPSRLFIFSLRRFKYFIIYKTCIQQISIFHIIIN